MLETFDVAEVLRLGWRDGVVSEHPWIWVRDHSHDPESLHPVTGQRLVTSTAIDPAERPVRVERHGDGLLVHWPGGSPPSVLPIEFLFGQRGIADRPELVPGWDAATIAADRPSVEAEAVLHTDDGLRVLLDHLHRYGVCLVERAPTTMQGGRVILERIGYVRRTIFGSMWEFGADLARADTAYTALELAPHTDGTYSHDAPGLQLLLCVEREGTGGETVIVDGFRIAEELRRTSPGVHELLTRVPVTGRYLGDGVHLEAERPVLRLDRNGRLVQVSLNHADRAPLALPPGETERFYAALRAFDDLATSARLQWRFGLEPGMAVIFDNWRVLHGRLAYTGRRRLCGGYLNREDVDSRRRRLAAADASSGRSRG